MKKLVAISLVLSKILLAQISPGELSSFHAKFDGLSNCTKCHTIGEGLDNGKCLDCHKEIRTRVEKNSGYHSSKEVKGKKCWACHSEHNGRNFQIIQFNKSKFDHRLTGYELTGKHKSIDCSECHNQKFIKDPALKKKLKSFLGLVNTCISCHQDIHQQTAGRNCEKCHNTFSFSSNIQFDHSKTSFQLIGAHKKVNCIDCHKKSVTENSTILKFVSKTKVECIDCHTDVHENKFGNNCLKCHNYNSFKNVPKQGFDHSKTGFPLNGKHQFVQCNECHKNKLTDPVKHNKCLDCHQDYHKGQFAIKNTPRDCEDCHSENGFTPSKFTLEQHQRTKFVLTGSHLAIECRSCHYKNDEWKFKFNSFQCIECHNNVHNQEISPRFAGQNNCENCHNTGLWSIIKFDHNQTKFTLSGKHAQTNCRSCHIKEFQNKKIHLFKSLKSDCLDCHKDFHNKQYASGECVNCHRFDNWKPGLFNHNETAFKLTGAHERVECIKCHPKVEMDNGDNFILFKIRRIRCSDCHLS
ncbi:MAG: cytochrome C [Ignavibacteria bacterium]|jgi:nitrate/TMAO reductase-like tetraheme cytochrome c subunit|nr:cytochrome C [Ignavibacteria bacterium]MDH7526867.1 cytochrome C [Ignavibacteria bacterium]